MFQNSVRLEEKLRINEERCAVETDVSVESRDVAVGMSDVTEIAGPICNPQGINRNILYSR